MGYAMNILLVLVSVFTFTVFGGEPDSKPVEHIFTWSNESGKLSYIFDGKTFNNDETGLKALNEMSLGKKDSIVLVAPKEFSWKKDKEIPFQSTGFINSWVSKDVKLLAKSADGTVLPVDVVSVTEPEGMRFFNSNYSLNGKKIEGNGDEALERLAKEELQKDSIIFFVIEWRLVFIQLRPVKLGAIAMQWTLAGHNSWAFQQE
jgi:hypothetical protein